MADQGLGSRKMDESKKEEIHRKGGKASGGKNLSHEDRVEGGKRSHGGRR